MNEYFLMFYNLDGNKKLAIELNDMAALSELDDKVFNFINKVCDLNRYTFSFYKRSVNGDFKNLPIIPIEVLTGGEQ